MNASLSRTESFASVISEDGSVVSATSEPKRTRKRFTNHQVMLLEQLFHETSHPSREQREKLSQKAELELRSVTVWFQNKRQTERKVALTNASNANNPNIQSAPSVPRTRRRVSSFSHVPSLDHIASRSEHRVQPQTPPRRRTMSSPDAALWENMPSSPSDHPPSSPEATRMIVEFGKTKVRRTRTLEWACAAARLADRQGKRIEEEDSNMGMVVDDGGDTDIDEAHEAVTPYNSFREDDPMVGVSSGKKTRVSRSKGKAKAREPQPGHDEETMNAALVLCGLRQ